MKTSLIVLSLLGTLTNVEAREKDARPCNNDKDCPTTECCGWAEPVEEGEGIEQKICWATDTNVYQNANGEKFTFKCDPDS